MLSLKEGKNLDPTKNMNKKNKIQAMRSKLKSMWLQQLNRGSTLRHEATKGQSWKLIRWMRQSILTSAIGMV